MNPLLSNLESRLWSLIIHLFMDQKFVYFLGLMNFELLIAKQQKTF